MSPAKRFLIAYVVIYLFVAIAVNMVWGPPGLSKDYLADYKNQHDQYLSITKSGAYKLWQQRPGLNEPSEALSEQIEFATTYEARPAFQAEQQRRNRYGIVFDVINALMVVILIYRFAKAPFLGFVDGQIAQLRERIEIAESESRTMAERKAQANAQLEGIGEVRDRMADDVAKRLEVERAHVKESTAQGMALLARETEDRKRHAELSARHALKETLVDEALGIVAQRYESHRSSASESQMIDGFLNELGQR